MNPRLVKEWALYLGGVTHERPAEPSEDRLDDTAFRAAIILTIIALAEIAAAAILIMNMGGT